MVASIPDAEIEDENKSFDTATLDKNVDFNLPTGSSEKLSNLLKNVLQAKVRLFKCMNDEYNHEYLDVGFL